MATSPSQSEPTGTAYELLEPDGSWTTPPKSKESEARIQPAPQPGEKKEESEDESKYPSTLAVTLMMIAISIAMFLVSLDRTIVATAIPRITDQFHSFDDIGWYASAYALTGCSMQLPLGRFYSFYSPKIVFLSLVFIFVVGSAVCAGAQNSTTIIVGRGIQGIGCAGVFSGSMILLVDNVPLRRRPMFMGTLMAVMTVSSIIGPLIGGALTSNATWRWCFIINVPIGVVTFIILIFTVKNTPGKEHAKTAMDKIKHLDPFGAAMLLPSVICLVLALEWGGSEYAWGSWRIILLLVLAGVLAIGFNIVQIMMPDTATVAPRVLGKRTVAASFYYSTCSGGAMMVVVYWIPTWFQAIKDATPVKSGEMTIPLLMSQSLGSIMAGILVSQVVGYASPFMLLSACLMAVGGGFLSTFTVNSGHAQWIGYQVLFGFGLGFGMQQPSTAVQTVLKEEDIASAISLIFFGMQLGGSISICIGQNVLDQKLIKTLTAAAIPGLDPHAVLNSGATEIRNFAHTAADLAKLLYAYNDSLTDVFYVAAALGGASVIGAALIEWKSVKGLEPF